MYAITIYNWLPSVVPCVWASLHWHYHVIPWNNFFAHIQLSPARLVICWNMNTSYISSEFAYTLRMGFDCHPISVLLTLKLLNKRSVHAVGLAADIEWHPNSIVSQNPLSLGIQWHPNSTAARIPMSLKNICCSNETPTRIMSAYV